jgi:periplasmic protein CpxP/Spy
MESKSSSKNKARLIVMVVFVIGFAAGALSLNLYQRLTSSKPLANKAEEGGEPGLTGNDYIINKMNQKLGLTDAQQSRIRAILEERNQRFGEIRKNLEPMVKQFEPQFNSVRQESREKIRALLSDEQRPKYDELVQEQDRQREQMREKHKGGR